MHKIMLSKKWIKYLKNLPESGMGYQIVSVTMKGNKTYKNVVVSNRQEIDAIYDAELPLSFNPDDIIDIKVTHLEKDKDFNPAKWNRFD